MQQMQEMRADRGVVGLDLDAAAVMGIVVPVKQHGAERGHQAVGDVAGAGRVVVVTLRQHAAERRDAGTHHVHRMRRRRQLFQRVQHRARQPAQRFQLRLVIGELGAGRQAAVHEQVRDFLEFADAGNVEDVVTPVVQVVAAAADAAKRGIPGDDARERHGFLWCRPYVSHRFLPKLVPRVAVRSAFQPASRKCRAGQQHPAARDQP